MTYWIYIWPFILFFPVAATPDIGVSSYIPEDETASLLPENVLQIENIGNGYSSPALSDSIIYITGEVEGMGFIHAFNWKGELVWKNCYGPEWTKSFRGSRAAPVVDQNRLYVCSGTGNLVCFHSGTGEALWSIDLIKDLGGLNSSYGYSMPATIEGDKLICSPGGAENNIVALNKYNGELLWTTPAHHETAGYGTPRVIKRGDLWILLTFTEFTFLGIDISSGEVLWSHELNFKGELPCNTPLYDDGMIYISAGPGNGATAFQLSPDGHSIRVIWKNREFDPFFGGFVMMNGYLVGSAHSSRTYVSLDKRTGEITSGIRFGTGASVLSRDIIAAYNQGGQVGIMRMEGDKLTLSHEFTVFEGTGEHFSIPVYFGNKLLIRHGNTLQVYNM